MDGISTGLSGVAVAGQSVAVSARNVANLNTPGYQAESLRQADLEPGGVRATGIQESREPAGSEGSNVDLATEAVNLDTQGLTYQANLKFMQVQQNLLGAALDMKA